MRFNCFDKKIRLLYIDDDRNDYLLMRKLLSRIKDLSFDIEWVGDYDRGLETIALDQHDLCLLDYDLGKRDGLELINDAKSANCELPFIMLSGKGDREVDLKAMNSGVYFYLDKNDLTADELERTLRYILEYANLLREVKELNESLEERVFERTRLLTQTKERLQHEIAAREKVQAELQTLRNDGMRRTLREISGSPNTTLTSRQFGTQPFQKSDPEGFDRFVASYESLLDGALMRRAYHVGEDTVSDQLRDMAGEMGSCRLTPRDIVEIYNTALKHKSNPVESASKAEAFLEEGRLILLELMGYLVSYYCNLVFSGTDFGETHVDR